ncbi:Mitochondrial import receptor subunit TOM20-1 [Tetrabaena socialis]|uniref:Mitochondrial import receptor subunit TOM20-1 n=1 Tax=Tetrabaena socialis TaxID=47790 RepID=A0A2J8A0K3_9CHLO|nr:Mitochondrial import receptor subunit TOM20-1 [Tetrabaena socialis]|eukprot:PNH06052.1 Mitochondrial import receptor subunit TOM20-1 [Tetrabaena socialis]
MALYGDDADREHFFETARQQAQREYEGDSTNVQALVRWGGAMLELAHYKQGEDSVDMIKDAIKKLQEAVVLDADRADAYWCLGNAYTSLHLYTSAFSL